MSTKHSDLVANAAARLQSADEAISSLEYTHNWETQLKDHHAYQKSWGYGTYLYGLDYYLVDTRDHDTGHSWGSLYASTKILLGSGSNRVSGNIGSDKVHTGAGDDIIRGGAGDDQLIGGDGDDIIYGDWGNDILYGGAGNDTIYGGTGDVELYYRDGKVFPRSGIGENYYGDGDDILIGGDGDDKLIDKGAGNNIFVGGKGFDIIHMGSGQNVVVIDQTIGENYYSYDFITGFGADDVLSLKGLSGDETSLEEVKAKLGIDWTEENGDTIIRASRENGPPEIIATLKNYTGLTIENFGLEAAPEPTSVGMSQERGYAVAGYHSQARKLTDLYLEGHKLDNEVLIHQVSIGQRTAINGIVGLGEKISASDFLEIRNGPNGQELWLKAGVTLTNDLIITFKAAFHASHPNFFWLKVGEDEAPDSAWYKLTAKHTDASIVGNDGVDHLKASSVQYGASDGGVNWMYGGGGNDIVEGAHGKDFIWGEVGNDHLFGRGGNDMIYGGDGNDVLVGGKGTNTLYGGKGNDKFLLLFTDGSSKDIIKDFSASDLLEVDTDVTEYASLDEFRAETGLSWKVDGADTKIFNVGGKLIAVLENYTEPLTLETFGLKTSPPPPPAPTITFTTSTIVTPPVVPPKPQEPSKPEVSQPTSTKVEEIGTDGKSVTESKSVKVTPESQTTDKVTTTVTVPETQTINEEQTFTLTPKPPASSEKAKTDTAAITAIFGTDESETISGTVDADLVYALKGNDLVRGGTGNDVIHGGDGNDNLYGDHGDDTLYGGAGNDNLRGGAGNDMLIGGDGDADMAFFLYSNLVSDAQSPVLTVDLNLKVYGGRRIKKTPEGSTEEMTFHRFWVDLNNNGIKDDADEYDYYTGIENFFIRGGLGDDKITGAKGDDVLHGHKGNDKLKGKAGNDRLVGNEGNDVLYGGAGDDILVGGAGRDIMVGGKGDDTFYIGDLASSVRLADVIKDYGKGNDMLSFVTGTHTVYVKNTGKDTILMNGTGDDAEIYAILRGYTDPLTIDDADGITFIEIV